MSPQLHDAIGNLTFERALERWRDASPAEPFLIWDSPDDGRIVITWADAVRWVARASRQLHDLGIGEGDRFCVHLRNRPETVALLFAAAAVGAAMVPTNNRLTSVELAYVLQHSRARAVFVEPGLSRVVDEAAAHVTPAPAIVDVGRQPRVFADDSASRGAEVPTGDAGMAIADNNRDAVVLYTSGTTAKPKGVRISEAALLNAGYGIALGIGFGSADRNFAALPLFHVNSLCYTLMTALVTGGSVVLADRFSASHYFRQVSETGATFGWMAATPMRLLMAQPPRPTDRVHAMRRVVFGQNLTPGEFAEWDRRFGVPLQQIYGMTETVTLPMMAPLHGAQPVDAIGRPALGAEARIVTDAGRDASPGERGELWLRLRPVRQMMSGYLHDDRATADAFTADWFRTGDWVVCDDRGVFRFIDRKRDVLKVSGENVSASEVECVLNEHPAVFDSAVVGKPDPLKGQVIAAFVVLEEGAAASAGDLIEWCRARLAAFKVPVDIEVRREFPRTSAGKIQKSLL